MHRGLITDWLIDQLENALSLSGPAASIKVGDGEAPDTGGWTLEQPGEGAFVPYVVVTALNGSQGPFQDPVFNQDTSWQLPYSMRCVGGSRQQADWCADQQRELMMKLQRSRVGEQPGMVWKLTRVRYTQIGGMTRNDATDPPLWECTDVVSLWIDLGP